MSNDAPAIYLDRIERHYLQGDDRLDILKGVDLAAWPGQSVALIAPSGAGKSTLLHIAGLLEHQDAGEVFIDAKATSGLGDAARTSLRRNEIGFVYQFHHLLPEFSALENVMLPQMVRGLKRSAAEQRALELLGYLGLKDRVGHRPGELSGGEQQRVAIARALVNDPALILADEPVGNLDDDNAHKIAKLLASACRERGRTLILVTHDRNLIHPVDHVFDMRSGSLTSIERVFAS
jgi:lipoprotein-releasing system ATP-binding protein